MNYHHSNTIRCIAGKPAVRSRYVCYNKPQEVVAFYLIADLPTTPAIGTRLIYDATGECFLDTEKGTSVFLAEKKGAILPIYAFSREIPPPFGRKNSTIEWRHGAWMKFLEPRTWKEA